MQLQELHMLIKKNKLYIELEIYLHLLIISFANDWIKILIAFSYFGVE